MIMVKKATPGSDPAVLSNLNPALDAKFTADANESAVANHYGWSRTPRPVEFKVNVVFKNAPNAEGDLMRPSHMDSREQCADSHFHPEKLPIKSSQTSPWDCRVSAEAECDGIEGAAHVFG